MIILWQTKFTGFFYSSLGGYQVIESILSAFQVTVGPPKNSRPFDGNVTLANLNPQCGPFPFCNIYSEVNLRNGIARFQADLAPDFIQAQILPRGRPHFSLLHVALVDDAVAATSFSLATGEEYGRNSRYIEMGAMAGFHREAFMRGSNIVRQFGTILVDGFRVYWQCQSRKENVSLIDQGIFQVSVVGLTPKQEVPVASIEGQYFRRKAIKRSVF
ncbi:MAG: hypothetical protein AAB877_01940 [Patescibacteria group bacterium]